MGVRLICTMTSPAGMPICCCTRSLTRFTSAPALSVWIWYCAADRAVIVSDLDLAQHRDAGCLTRVIHDLDRDRNRSLPSAPHEIEYFRRLVSSNTPRTNRTGYEKPGLRERVMGRRQDESRPRGGVSPAPLMRPSPPRLVREFRGFRCSCG